VYAQSSAQSFLPDLPVAHGAHGAHLPVAAAGGGWRRGAAGPVQGSAQPRVRVPRRMFGLAGVACGVRVARGWLA
jgi:hypothetical protein